MTDTTSSGGDVAVVEPARVSRSGSDTRARSQVVMVRLTPAEKARVEAVAAANRMSVPALFRLAAEAICREEESNRAGR